MQRGGDGACFDVKLVGVRVELFGSDAFLGHFAHFVQDLRSESARFPDAGDLFLVFDENMVFFQIERGGIVGCCRGVRAFSREMAELPFFSTLAPTGVVSADHDIRVLLFRFTFVNQYISYGVSNQSRSVKKFLTIISGDSDKRQLIGDNDEETHK